MTLLAVRDLTLRIAGRTLLEGADLSVEPGRRIGLVGRNGAGKSTLLRAIGGEIAPDGGEIRLAARARMGQVRQEAPSGQANLLDTVLEGDPERLSLLREADGGGDPARLGEVHERLRAIGADSAPSRAASILAGLGFDEAQQARAVSSFSGGWRMRVALATALFASPDLLLLDEPTNHLDLEATLWLEGWLARFPGACLVVSHDRGLLDRAVEAIAHLDRGRISLTPGGFDEFVRIRTEQAMQQARAAERIAAQRAHMQSFVDRFRAKATKARQAQSRLRALEKLPVIEGVVEATPTRFAFPEAAAAGAADPDAGARERGLRRAGGAARPEPERGHGRPHRAARRQRAGQEHLRQAAGRAAGGDGGHGAPLGQAARGLLRAAPGGGAGGGESPVDHMARALPRAVPTQVRAQLARFGLDAERADTPTANLSGGEKARLLLALATRDAPQLLILDEPTNHLDMDARDALVRALADYTGAVLLITHDPHLVSLVADRLWLVGEGTVRPFEGDMDEYRALLAERARPARAAETAPNRRDDRRERAVARVAVAPLRRAAREAEALLGRLAAERATLEARLADPAAYAPGRAAELTAATTRLAAIGREQAGAEAAWLEAEEALEAAS